MTNPKEERWLQRFKNFENSYMLLSKYAGENDQMTEKMVQDVKESYYPALQKLYEKLKEEV